MALVLPIAAGLLAMMIVLLIWPEPRTTTPARLKLATTGLLDRYPALRQIADAVAPLVQAVAPKTVAQVDHKLMLAGQPFGRMTASQIFGLALVAAVVYAPIMMLAMSMVLGGAGLLLGFVLGVASPFIIAIVLVSNALKTRARRLDQQFPYFLDFLVMMKEAGENLPMALRTYVNTSGGNELGEAMRVVVDGVQNHREGLRGALMDFHEECPSEIGRSTLRSIVTAEEMGARSTAMLRDIARDMRGTRYEQAEKAAERLRASSTIPAVIMFTGAFLMILAGSLGKMTQFSG